MAILRRVAVAATATLGTAAACRHLERQRKPVQACSPITLSAVSALPSLRTSGVGVVDGVLDPDLVRAVKATAAFQSCPAHLPKLTRADRERKREEAFRAKRGDAPWSKLP